MASIFHYLLASAGLILLLIASTLFWLVVKSRVALAQFKLKTNGLPLFDDVGFVANNLFTLTLKTRGCKLIDETHKRLGKTFGWITIDRYGVCSTDLELAKLIVVDEGDIHINRTKTDFPLHEIENSLLMAEDDQWRKLRRYFAPAFRSNKFKTPNVIDEIENSIQMLIDHIEDKLSQRANASKLFEADDLVHKFSLQLVFSCLYKQYNLIDFNDEHCYWAKVIDEGHEALVTGITPKIALLFPFLNPTIDWFIYNFHPHGAWRRIIKDFIMRQTIIALEARKHLKALMTSKEDGGESNKINKDNFQLADGTQFRRNMADHVIDHYLDGKLTKDEFFNSSFLMLGAADKTTTDALTHTIYLLAINPEKQELAREAVKQGGIEAEYLTWCINESLRLLPPVPAGCSRTTKRDIRLDGGTVVPAGSFVAFSTFTIHRLPEYWGEDANEFNPNRWQNTSHHHPLQFTPFGHGLRTCIGKDFAMFEMKKVLSALLTRYKFEAQRRNDAYEFDAVYLTIIIPASKTYVTIKRL